MILTSKKTILMKTDLNQAIFMVKKMIKQINTNAIDKDKSCQQLSAIVEFAQQENMLQAAQTAQKCLIKFKYTTYPKSLLTSLYKLNALLCAKKKKIRMMACREAKARASFFFGIKNIKDKHDLSLYDVVRIPTQGGMHYSVITNIKRKQVVECYPITSTNQQRLSLVGCDYYPLQTTSENGEQLFLTSSRIQISYDAAAKSFIRKYDNPAEIKLALTAFAN